MKFCHANRLFRSHKIWATIAAFVLIANSFLFINFYISRIASPFIYDNIEDIPQSQVALILGARVYENGTMSDILTDRVLKALELYRNGIVQKFLVSGDHGTTEYDEVNTVKNYLLSEGVPPENIFLDHAGFDTYDSLYRARDIFQIDSLIIVTQEFHLPRAVYIGRSLGLDTFGFVADRQPYLAAEWNSARESLARVKAFLNVFFHSTPKFLGEQIPITGDGKLSWDIE